MSLLITFFFSFRRNSR